MPQGAPRVPSHAARALRRINGWQRATSEPSPVAEPGDSLSEDDAKVPTLGVSSATYQCFTHAVDEPKSEYAAASSEPTTTSARARSSCIGRRLYAAFADAAHRHGALRLKAITSLGNTGSIGFHRVLPLDAVQP
ncbi:hypothetical protein GCM10015536_47800 [Streptomyces griseomycini]|nr:hypothetical protein GCM10015536_47800 [Streptomyces griseomycini]